MSGYQCPVWAIVFSLICAIALVVGVGLGVHYHDKSEYKTSDTEITRTPRAITTTTSSPPPKISTSAPPNEFSPPRLPKTLMPMHYQISLQPYFTAAMSPPNKLYTFDGTIEILFVCLKATSYITIHSENLNISASQLIQGGEGGGEIKISGMDFNTTDTTVTFHTPSALIEDMNYTLQINYTGTMHTTSATGFYVSTYMQNGTVQSLAVTTLESQMARSVFPCFDEPELKATFAISVMIPAQMNATSNMEVLSTINTPDPKWLEVTFATTPKMSTYLVAVYVGELQFKSAQSMTHHKTVVRCWARPDVVDACEFGAESGAQMLKYYEDYFNVSYPFTKLDLMAVPMYGAGMENWGMITFREPQLLYYPDESSAASLMFANEVPAHEIMHLWSGDLVTTSWWNDAWLNEGFAKYFEFHGMSSVDLKGINGSKWQTHDLFIQIAVMTALTVDSLENSNAVDSPVINTQSEVEDHFNGITYYKGGSLLWMIRNLLNNTETDYRSALHHYFSEYSYSNSNTTDLLAAMSHASGLDVDRVMSTWFNEPGYPVVTIVRDYNQEIKINQHRFYLMPTGSSDDTEWMFFLRYRFQSEMTNERKLWVTSADSSVNDPHFLDWVIANEEYKGFFRVNYDKTNWMRIASQLASQPSIFSTATQAQLIDDIFALTYAQEIESYDIAFQISKYLRNSSSADFALYAPWRVFHTRMQGIQGILQRTEAYEDFVGYMSKMLTHAYATVGWDDSKEPLGDIIPHWYRDMILDVACRMNVADCQSVATTHFDKLSNCTKDCTIGVNIRRTVYCQGASNTANGSLDLQIRFLKPLSPDRRDILAGMACTVDYDQLQNVFLAVINAPDLSGEDAESFVDSLAWNQIGQKWFFPYLKANWNNLPATKYMMLSYATQYFNTEQQIYQLQQLAAEHSDAESIVSGLESTLKYNIQWTAKHFEHLTSIFNSN